MPKLIIVGGGLAGLAAAHHARERGIDFVLLEASDRVGGLVRTERADGFVIDRGPESILVEKPAAITLARAVGLESEIIGTLPANRGAFVVHQGRLERVPFGFSLLAPTDIPAFLRSPLLSTRGKARALLDIVLPRGEARDDESLSSFVRRRLGGEVLERIAQPMVGGIYGAHPDELSLGATMPRFLEAERAHRSVILGLRRAASGPSHGARYGLFASFRHGMGALVEALDAELRPSIRLETKVASIRKDGGVYRVALANGELLSSEALVLASSGPGIARLVSDVDDVLARDVASVPHGNAAIVTFAFRNERIVRRLDAYGYVTPTVEGRRVIASTWSSSKWAGRAPGGYALVRFFLGRAGDDALALAPERELVALARNDAAALLGATGAPELVRVDRAIGALPRYVVGHLETARRIEARVASHIGLGLAGAFLRGVGMPDTVASAQRAVDGAIRTGT
jgi:protoporphyrinogen/coproporphyrinogen III oxidase